MLRIVFTILTVLQHSCNVGLFGANVGWQNAGNFAVEFFFMVSGYFMVASWEKSTNCSSGNNIENTTAYMKHKIGGLILPYITGFLVAMILVPLPKILDHSMGLLDIAENIIKHIPELFGIYGSGFLIYEVTGNSASWYISCMLLSMIILYSILCKFKESFTHIACPLIGILLLAYRCNQFEHFGTWANWTNLNISVGMIRAIGGLCFGCFVYVLAKKLRTVNFIKAGKLILAIIESVCWLGIIAGITFFQSYRGHYGLEVLMVPTLAITFSEQSALFNLFNRKIFGKLGKPMIYLYMSHWPIVLFMRQGYCSGDYWINTLILMVSSIVLAVLEALICRLFRVILPKIKKALIASA